MHHTVLFAFLIAAAYQVKVYADLSTIMPKTFSWFPKILNHLEKEQFEFDFHVHLKFTPACPVSFIDNLIYLFITGIHILIFCFEVIRYIPFVCMSGDIGEACASENKESFHSC